jgi:energy-coupling factor transporter ATP-binding protein EcfA2
MPRFDHLVSSPYTKTFRTEAVAGMFDCAPSDKLTRSWALDIPIDGWDWQIGLIVGPSGTGKTTIGRRLWGDEAYHRGFDWPKDRSVLDGFPSALSVKEITGALSSVGFSSPPSWLLPFHVLSNGQQFRAELARAMIDDRQTVVIDEFTSVVDRTVAKIGSAAVSKAIKRGNKRMVALSCHYDIREWLQPDWTLDLADGSFTRGAVRRPKITINIKRCERDRWREFSPHHYMSSALAAGAQCWLATANGSPACFVAVIPYPHQILGSVWRCHRIVTLPDFQGVGIGNAVGEKIADHYSRTTGRNYYISTSHPALIAAYSHRPCWAITRRPSRVAAAGKGANAAPGSRGRITAGFLYRPGKGQGVP